MTPVVSNGAAKLQNFPIPQNYFSAPANKYLRVELQCLSDLSGRTHLLNRYQVVQDSKYGQAGG